MNEKPDIIKKVEKQTHKTYGKLEGGKHRICPLNFLLKRRVEDVT